MTCVSTSCVVSAAQDKVSYYEDTIFAPNAGGVMNDGQRWIGNNTVALEERFSQKTETNFFTVDPESEFIKVLAIKTGMTEDDLKKKIEDSWKRIENAFEKSSKQGTLSIYALKTYPTKSVFISENILVETPYQISSGRVKIPVYL